MRKLRLFLIIAGLAIIVYPLLDRAYTRYCQQKALAEWEARMFLQESFTEASASDSVPTGYRDGSSEADSGEESLPAGDSTAITQTPLGILEIEKIALKLPVFRGTSHANLKIGAGLLEGSAGIGEPGNAVLTAHRSHTYGHLFNRLDELEAGDVIKVSTPDAQYEYVVESTAIVEAEDTSLLDSVRDERILTLYTCHPLHSINPPNRLIVKCSMSGTSDTSGGSDAPVTRSSPNALDSPGL